MTDFPEAILNYLQRVLIQERIPAYFVVDRSGILQEMGGNLSTYGLDHLERGKQIANQAEFLEGLLPLESHEALLPCIEVSRGRFADIHLFQDEGRDVVLLVDATNTEIQEALLHQKANDLHLLRNHHAQFLNLLSSLDIGLLEQIENRKFRSIGIPPNWLEHCGFRYVSEENVYQVASDLDFLSNFIDETEKKESSGEWGAEFKHSEKRLKSGPWVESDPDGSEWYFEATSIKKGNYRILLIERIAPYLDERFGFLQKGREQRLEYLQLARKEKVMREKEARNRMLLQAVPDWIFRINRQGIILDLKATMGKNPAMFAEFVGQPLAEVFPEDAAQKMIDSAREALATSQLQICNFLLGSSTSSFDFEARIVAVGPNEVVLIVRDLPGEK
jgi:PAS domain-containing protein